MAVRPLSLIRWTALCAAAEAVGMTAAAAAAKISQALVNEPGTGRGAAMGAVLGSAQATVLRPHLRHPWRWAGASMAAWAPAMAVIFLGAGAPGADWPLPTVVALGTVTGLAAGTVLGLVSGWFLPSLDGPSAHNRIVVSLLGSPLHRVLDGPLLVLRLRGVVTGRTFELPVQYADADNAVVVAPGRPETKRWWRNLVRRAPVDVLLKGRWQHGDGILLHPGEAGYDTALAAYQRRWPRLDIPPDSLLVLVRLATLSPTAGRTPPSPPDAG